MKHGRYGGQQTRIVDIVDAVRDCKGDANYRRRRDMQASRNADYESRYVTRPKRAENPAKLARVADAAVAASARRKAEVPTPPPTLGVGHYKAILASA